MMPADAISITQGFLAQTLLETEQEVLKNPAYNSPGEVFNVSTYLLSEAFRYLMMSVGNNPGYGVKAAEGAGGSAQGGPPGEILAALGAIRYGDLNPEQKAEVDESGRVLEILLRDPPARLLILGLIEGYKALEGERSAAVPQDSDGSA